MFEGLYFEYPKLITLVVIYIACEAYCKLRSSAIYFPNAAALTRETTTVSTLMWILKWLSVVLLTLAIMSPVKDTAVELAPSGSYDVGLVLDVSQSMQLKNFDMQAKEKSRLEIVQRTLIDFVAARDHDTFGVVYFGEDAVVVSPLTDDRESLQQIIGTEVADVADKTASLDKAVGQTARMMQSSKANRKIAILMSGGSLNRDTEVALERALTLAKQEQARIYTIGIGIENRDHAALLQNIAKESGANSFSAANAKELQTIYREIDRLERSGAERFDYVFKKYFYIYPLFLAFFTLLIYVYLRNRRGWL